MGKKEQYFCLAEKMYVEEQQTISCIAKKLQITDKTLHGWKKEGDWDNKRKRYLASQYSCYSGLYELLGKLTTKAIADFNETGEAPDRCTSNLIGKLIDKLPKLKDFESTELAEKLTEDKEPTSTNTDILLSVDKYLRGDS